MPGINKDDLSTFKTNYEKVKQCLPESNFKEVDDAIEKLDNTADMDKFKELIVQVLYCVNHKEIKTKSICEQSVPYATKPVNGNAPISKMFLPADPLPSVGATINKDMPHEVLMRQLNIATSDVQVWNAAALSV